VYAIIWTAWFVHASVLSEFQIEKVEISETDIIRRSNKMLKIYRRDNNC